MPTPDRGHPAETPPLDPLELWPLLHRRLNRLSASNAELPTQLHGIYQELAQVLATHPDDSLFVLVQMLQDPHHGYSATHALLAAATCLLIAPSAGIAGAPLNALIQAALTMNIAMRQLQDQLVSQSQPLDVEQRLAIEQHPLDGAALLRKLGVMDMTWLSLVADHHETPDGQGYPRGKLVKDPLQHLLRMSDLFIARISPRRTRRGLAPNIALRNLYLEMRDHSGELSALFAKQMGMYPPGSYVQLNSGELAVIMRRGERVNCPLAIAITDPLGAPLSSPPVRDTQTPAFAVKRFVYHEEVRVRVELARLRERL